MTTTVVPATTTDAAAPGTAGTAVINVAVVGAGTEGLTHLARVARQLPDAHIDLYDRLPAPPGVLAHAAGTHLRLIGGVTVGRDIDLADLHSLYDFVVDTTRQPHPAPGARRHPRSPRGCPLEFLARRRVAHTLWRAPQPMDDAPLPATRPAWRRLLASARQIPVCDQ